MYSRDGHQIYVNVDSAQRLPSVPDWCIPGPAIRCGGGIPHKMEGACSADGARFSHLPCCFCDILFSNECSSWTKTTNSLNSRGLCTAILFILPCLIAKLWPIEDCDIEERSSVSFSLNSKKTFSVHSARLTNRIFKVCLKKSCFGRLL